ncbi:MAG: FixH family protein [Gammaproteobacteria bacterium]|nr:FixH family protein [Gammaproteobacteria bacterium]
MMIRPIKNTVTLILLLMTGLLLQACEQNTPAGNDDTVSLTSSYRVEYLSDMSMISEGKSVFSLQISDRASGNLLPGLNVSVMPMMTMTVGHMHDSPVGEVTDNGDGTYQATVYYLMPSTMMNGDPMGDWDLQVMIGGMAGEVAHFNPQVMMSMGDTVKATLMGQNDMIMGMMAPEKRKYFLFKESLMGMTGNHSFSLFLAARESMMSHVAVYPGAILNAGSADYELSVASVTVEVSTDTTNWSVAAANGNGYWSVTGLSGLVDGDTSDIYVRLSVNGERKTTDGNTAAGDGSNDYAVFSVTPGMTMSM